MEEAIESRHKIGGYQKICKDLWVREKESLYGIDGEGLEHISQGLMSLVAG
jgi:hypothetical protein